MGLWDPILSSSKNYRPPTPLRPIDPDLVRRILWILPVDFGGRPANFFGLILEGLDDRGAGDRDGPGPGERLALFRAIATACFCGLPDPTSSDMLLDTVDLDDPLLSGIIILPLRLVRSLLLMR